MRASASSRIESRERGPGVLEELERTALAVIAADEAYLREAIESGRWERRGLLQRLAHVDAGAAEIPLAGSLAPSS
jgi:hypothetical protein